MKKFRAFLKAQWLTVKLNWFYIQQARKCPRAKTLGDLRVIDMETNMYERNYNSQIFRLDLPYSTKLKLQVEVKSKLKEMRYKQ